jgi:hypothetical protein
MTLEATIDSLLPARVRSGCASAGTRRGAGFAAVPRSIAARADIWTDGFEPTAGESVIHPDAPHASHAD